MNLGKILGGFAGGLGGGLLSGALGFPLTGAQAIGMQPMGLLPRLLGMRRDKINVTGLGEEGSPFADLEGIGNMNFLGNLGGMFR